jgi:PAS domain S-box-containing protein
MTERRQEAQDARDGELFRLLVENVEDYAIFVLDPEGRVESWNAGAERLLGHREEDMIGQSIDVFFTPEDIENGFPQREMRQALKEGRGNDDRWHLRKDGSRFWCGGTMTPLWDDDHRLRGFAKIMRDRTEWKRAEEERAGRTREAERRQRLYDAVLSNTPDLVYVFDLTHRFTYANEGLLRLWGKTWDEAIGKTCLELGYEPWHAAMHDREIEQVVATKQPVKGEVPFTGTSGRRIYEYIFVPVIGENGEVEAVAGTTRDVTERRQAEEQVREASATLRSFYDTAPVMMGVVEVGGEDVLHLTDNAATGRFFGTAPDSLAGRSASEMGVPPDHLR